MPDTNPSLKRLQLQTGDFWFGFCSIGNLYDILFYINVNWYLSQPSRFLFVNYWFDDFCARQSNRNHSRNLSRIKNSLLTLINASLSLCLCETLRDSLFLFESKRKLNSKSFLSDENFRNAVFDNNYKFLVSLSLSWT